MKLANAIALAFLLVPSAARAQVDCFRTATPAEVTICRNPELARADAQAASIFSEVYHSVGNRPGQGDLVASERRWIAERDTCNLNRLCLEVTYRSHIEYLCGLLLQAEVWHDACRSVQP